MTGRASKGIASELRRHGFLVVTDPLSCLVDRNNELLPAETDRATAWAVDLAAALNRTVGSKRSIAASPPNRSGETEERHSETTDDLAGTCARCRQVVVLAC